MKSIWTDLLFLHGHLANKDLNWQLDAERESRPVASQSRQSQPPPMQQEQPASHGCTAACA